MASISGSGVKWLVLVLALLAAACGKNAGNPAPPRIDEVAELPQLTSTITVPATVDLAELEARINRSTPATLWQIDRQEPRCVPAQRVSLCTVAKKACKGNCRKTLCELGLGKTKITPDISCRITGQVTRGPIRLGGRGELVTLIMPVRATIAARDIGGVIKRETATGAADVRASVKLSLTRDWAPVAKVDIAYDWTNPPGISILGKRIVFVDKADAKLKAVIAKLERDLPRELEKVHARDEIAAAWRKGFATILLNREKPPAWMRTTPQRIGYGGYRVNGRKLELALSAEAITETFIGEHPPPAAAPTPLPPPSPPFAERGLRFRIPVLADFAQLEPVVERALGKLAKKGISLPKIGPVNVAFGKVTIYATEGGRLAVGVKANANVRNSLMTATKGEVWLSAIPYNEANSQVVRVRDLKIAGRTDREAVTLLLTLFADQQVLDEIRVALTHDFAPDYQKVLVAARKAIAERREGDFLLSADIARVDHGAIKVTGQGLFLPVEVTGTAHILYSPLHRAGRH